MTRFLLKRLGLALVTLFLLSLLVFFLAQLLPGDVGRAILGPLADQESVDRLNHELGTDRPWYEQYWSWVTAAVQGDLGTSYTYQRPVTELVGEALWNSLKLAAIAFLIVVPLGIVGGVISALRYGRVSDRVISIGGLSATVVPEFVSGIVLILVLTIWLDVLPLSADAGPGAGALSQIHHLILPALPLVFLLFGYIARMARAGTIEALDSDYTRTATLKGLSHSEVVRGHVLRNALLPTISVISTQVGYLIGGLVVIETLFNYQGIGLLILNAAQAKDFPLLAGGILVIGVVYLVVTLIADLLYAFLNPRIRFAAE
jgi:peptide/nickel transport system permease protein